MQDSRNAIKADAAERVFGLSTAGLSWAMVADGIDATHPAFYARLDDRATPAPADEATPGFAVPSRVVATYDFSQVPGWLRSDEAPDDVVPRDEWDRFRNNLPQGLSVPWGRFEPLLRVPHDGGYRVPDTAHGTHTAGILGGNWPEEELLGICPEINLYDLRVFGPGLEGDELAVLAALDFVRWLNQMKAYKVIHGVGVDLAVRWDRSNYACGESPVCLACDELVRSGVVVVVPAGNEGSRTMLGALRGPGGQTGPGEEIVLTVPASITDPGNAESVITVGATHRWRGERHGISYFSSRGPTADGRYKPDIVAPGEKIIGPAPGGTHRYMDGTSMAAAHASGAAALLMARNSGLIGQPERIKQILCETATDLQRDRYFQGAGMLDVLRALQSV